MIKNYSRTFLFVFSCFSFLAGTSQESIDLFSLTSRFVPSQESTSDQRGFEENGLSANLKVPVPIQEHGIFFNELNVFNYSLYSPSNDFDSENRRLNLTGVILKTGYIFNLPKDRTIDFLWMPRWMSDFKEVNTNHLQIGGIVSFSKKFSEDFLLRVGLIYNKEEFGSFYNPLIQMYWKIAPRWTFTCSLPFVSRLTFQKNEKNGFGLYHFSPTTTYSSSDQPDYYYEKNIISGGLFWRHSLFRGLFLEWRGGLNLVHTYDQYQRDQQVDWKFVVLESTERLASDTQWKGQNYFLEFRIGYNLAIPK